METEQRQSGPLKKEWLSEKERGRSQFAKTPPSSGIGAPGLQSEFTGELYWSLLRNAFVGGLDGAIRGNSRSVRFVPKADIDAMHYVRCEGS